MFQCEYNAPTRLYRPRIGALPIFPVQSRTFLHLLSCLVSCCACLLRLQSSEHTSGPAGRAGAGPRESAHDETRTGFLFLLKKKSMRFLIGRATNANFQNSQSSPDVRRRKNQGVNPTSAIEPGARPATRLAPSSCPLSMSMSMFTSTAQHTASRFFTGRVCEEMLCKKKNCRLLMPFSSSARWTSKQASLSHPSPNSQP